MKKGRKILVTGGIKGGKSSFALELADQCEGPKIFIATAEAFDDDMKKSIARHQAERSKSYSTIEEPIKLADALSAQKDEPIVVIDCVTLWVNNLLHHFESDPKQIQNQIDIFLNAFNEASSTVIIVTNEVGLGVVPESPTSRYYLKLLGNLNKELAKRCDDVALLVCGIPQMIKGKRKERADAI